MSTAVDSTRLPTKPPTLYEDDGHRNSTNTRSASASNTATTSLPPPLLTSLISGACAGAVAKSVVAPLDRTKIYFQVTQTRFTYRNAIAMLRRGYQRHGISNWWRGNSATMARIVPYAAINFAAHDRIKAFFLMHTDQKVLPKTKRFVGGSLAGVTACTCTYPLDMIRARMAMTGRAKYGSLRSTFKQVYKQEGLRSFWNGFVPTIMGIIPYAGTSFFVYETSKKWYHDTYGGDVEFTVTYRLAAGALAGACGQALTYPMDVVKRRMQTDGMDGSGYRYRNLLQTLRYIWRSEGMIKGLF